QAARELEPERDLEDAPQPAPALRLDVAEPVLHERVLDRQVEEDLEERRGGEHRREAGVVGDSEPAGRDHGREKAEERRGVDPERRRRASPEDSGAHRAPRYSQVPLSDGSLPSPALSASRALSTTSLSRLSGWALPVAFCLLFTSVEFQPSFAV